MTHLDDEQLTALQDGEGRPEERAHLATCDRCGGRAEALAVVAALVATPPPVPSEADRRAAVAAALAEADEPAGPAGRDRRRPPAWLLPAAAVVALLALVAAIVPQLGGRSDDDAETAQRSSRGLETTEGGDAGAAGGLAQERAAGAAPPGQTDLGVVDDEAELADRVGALVLAQSSAADEAAPAANRCAAAFAAAGEALGPLRLRAALEWRGQAAEVFSDGARAVVVDAGGCTTLADVALR